MSATGSRTVQRLGAVVLAPVALLGALWMGQRAARAVRPEASSAAVSSAVVRPTAASRLSTPTPTTGTGFAGPDRAADAPEPDVHETRTWYAAGRWWAVLNRAGDGALTIWGLRTTTGPWVDTGVLVDDRPFARPVVVWTGTELVVASSGTRDYAGHALRTNRLTWDAGSSTWVQEADFPVTASGNPAPGVQLGVEPDGTEWLARQDADRVVVAKSGPSGLEHTRFAPLPGGIAGSDVGGFDLLVSGTTVRIAWRSKSSDSVHVTTWDGTQWTTIERHVYGVGGIGPVTAALAGPAAPSTLLVLLPTTLPSRGTNDRDPALLLLALDGDRVETSVVSRGEDGLAGAGLVVDTDQATVHVIAVARPAPRDAGAPRHPSPVVDKTADLSDLAFAPGPGAVVLYGDVGTRLAAPVVPGTAVGPTRGLLVMVAGRDLSGWRTTLVGGAGVDAGTLAQRTGTVDVVHDTFNGLQPDDPRPAAWHAGTSAALEADVVDAGDTGRALLVSNTDGGPASVACRAIPASRAPVVVRADVVAKGTAGTDAKLLTLKGPDGSLASARLGRKGQAGWSGPHGRVIGGSVAMGTPLRVTIRVDPTARTATVRIETGSGVVAEGADIPLLASGKAGPDEVCVGPGSNDPSASLLLTDLLVQES
ncbi:hypothetical protein [Aquihabitans sp. McL0605]|uniref:hypothetical protein n=1 Tax=Aquihabitans sp. McL0605 TaxID=3415671 RepID=UPI003CF811E6